MNPRYTIYMYFIQVHHANGVWKYNLYRYEFREKEVSTVRDCARAIQRNSRYKFRRYLCAYLWLFAIRLLAITLKLSRAFLGTSTYVYRLETLLIVFILARLYLFFRSNRLAVVLVWTHKYFHARANKLASVHVIPSGRNSVRRREHISRSDDYRVLISTRNLQDPSWYTSASLTNKLWLL